MNTNSEVNTHNMCVNSDYEINTDELPEVLDEADLDVSNDNLNDW